MIRKSLLLCSFGLLVISAIVMTPRTNLSAGAPALNTLCAKEERVIFSCLLRRPAKMVSVCASRELTSDKGYLQYRFGLPGKIELEFPKDRANTQQQFEYSHYFRARVDLTEINFTVDGVSYSVFDDYQGEEKPQVSEQGVAINWPGTDKKEVRYICSAKPKADYADLQAVLKTPE
ncbi:MAG TPA: hypothetical protein VN696_13055 [Pyrinomonadaceae bacterium]|nr:hypothetical protein [Pyrinomonadaceae bacterium]